MKRANCIARVAFRREGIWLVAYLADPETMDGAIEISRLALKACEVDGGADGELFSAWKAALSEWLCRAAKELGGLTVLPDVIERPAKPEEIIQ